MKESGLALIEEMVTKFRPLPASERQRYALRLGALVGEEMAAWLVPLLVHPPSAGQLEELKVGLAAHAKFELYVAEVSDAASPGSRALARLAVWAVARREPEEDEDDADDCP